MNLRERKKAVTREALQQAAHMLARRVPWTDVTVDEIARTAGVSRRTFFNYFDSKDAVLLSAQADHTTAVLAVLEERPVDEPVWASLTQVATTSMADATADSVRAFRGLWYVPAERDAALSVRRDLEVGLADRVHARRQHWPYAHAQLVVAVFLATVRASTTIWLEGERTSPLTDDLEANLARVAIAGPPERPAS